MHCSAAKDGYDYDYDEVVCFYDFHRIYCVYEIIHSFIDCFMIKIRMNSCKLSGYKLSDTFLVKQALKLRMKQYIN